ncbi:hypothetical protein ABZ388_06630 [Micromonospora parva]|uniref:hypothetical protein n=1 Tax=Micromonospora parva TaxID=1464048 RepID=UPI0033E72340
MNLPEWLAWAGPYVDLAQQNAQHVAVGAGIVGALIAARTIRRFTKNREHDEVAANLGVLLFLVVTTEGMWEVVYHKLDVPWLLAVAMFMAYDVVIYGERAAALKALAKAADARIGGHLAIIWGLSIAASITVSFASGNMATWFFRFFSPLVGAALATQKILAKRDVDVKRQSSNWIWTPDRLMVRWGWKKPGAVDDLSEVFAQRRIAALVDAGLELRAQQKAAEARTEPAKASRWRRREDPLVVAQRRVQELMKAARPADAEAARKQLQLTLNAERELFRPDDELDERGRQTLDEVRLIMRQATDRLRPDHARAFRREPTVELDGIRMPAHLAAQIGDMPEGWKPGAREPRREPGTDSPPATVATQHPTQRRLTESVSTAAQRADDKKIAAAHARLTKRLKREPTGQELGDAAGVSKATANRWKRDNPTTTKGN